MDSAALAKEISQPPAGLNEAQSPYKAAVWRQLTPRERLRRELGDAFTLA